jgi:hypothetical protein
MKEIVIATIQVETNQFDFDSSPRSLAMFDPMADITGIGTNERPYP